MVLSQIDSANENNQVSKMMLSLELFKATDGYDIATNLNWNSDTWQQTEDLDDSITQ